MIGDCIRCCAPTGADEPAICAPCTRQLAKLERARLSSEQARKPAARDPGELLPEVGPAGWDGNGGWGW